MHTNVGNKRKRFPFLFPIDLVPFFNSLLLGFSFSSISTSKRGNMARKTESCIACLLNEKRMLEKISPRG